MRRLSMILLGSCALCVALAACGSGGGVSTASILGGGQASSPETKPADPVDRATQVGAVSARAEKCGFNFDPGQLRASYLAAETRDAAAPEALNKAERAYDYTYGAVKNAIANNDDFCTNAKVREIKTDLTRHLAGDFSPAAKKVAQGGSWLDTMAPPINTREVLNPDWINDPKNEKRTKRVSD
jgi:hypothetical protein